MAKNPTLIFLDPPFNIGQAYEHGDDRPDYYGWFHDVLQAAVWVLADNGSIWINCPDQHVARFAQFAEDCQLTMENWCIWHYRFAQCQPNRFLRSKTHVLWFSKDAPIVNRDAALVPSDRASIYNDQRVFDTERGGTRMDFDVWGFDPYWGRVQGNNRERITLAPNQIPEKYLERVIGVSSNPGDLVVDPFCGSGTTARVGNAKGRRVLTGDISERICQAAYESVVKGAVRV